MGNVKEVLDWVEQVRAVMSWAKGYLLAWWPKDIGMNLLAWLDGGLVRYHARARRRSYE